MYIVEVWKLCGNLLKGYFDLFICSMVMLVLFFIVVNRLLELFFKVLFVVVVKDFILMIGGIVYN